MCVNEVNMVKVNELVSGHFETNQRVGKRPIWR